MNVDPNARKRDRLGWRVRVMRTLLRVEHALSVFWRTAALTALFVGLTLLGLWGWLPGYLHVAVLLVFALAAIIVVRLEWVRIAWPGTPEAERRLEVSNQLLHRPISTLNDSYAGNPHDHVSRELFELHKKRTLERLQGLRLAGLRTQSAQSDRFALRAIGYLILVWGLVAGWSQASVHFAALANPDFSRGLSAGTTGELTLWITPPAYTGVPPIWLDPNTTDENSVPLDVPVRSELFVQVRGGDDQPELVVDDSTVPFETAGDANYELHYTLDESAQVAVRQDGADHASWTFNIIPDELPVIRLDGEPSETLRTSLRLDVVANDDYGLRQIIGTIGLTDRETGDTLEINIPLPRQGIGEYRGASFFNLTAHPWAGSDATLVLTATDMIDQEGVSATYTFSLPERYFSHPVAREIIAQRKRLTLDRDNPEEIASHLHAISREPSEYLGEFGIHLSLVTASTRLRLDSREGRTGATGQVEPDYPVVGLLWDTALAIEEGPLAFAEMRVRALQEELLEALASNAPASEVERLIAELSRAMDSYMRALSERMRADPGELFDPTDAMRAVGSRELNDLVDRIGELYRTGSTEQARTLLNRLQEIMENIQTGNLSDLTGNVTAEMMEIIQTVRQLLSDQQGLLDESFELLRQELTDGALDSRTQALSQKQLQRVLRELLAGMEERNNDTPHSFGRADRSMGRAFRQLRQNLPGLAVDHQSEAIEFLREGASEIMRQLIDQAGDSATGDGPNYFSAPRDPVGRQSGSNGLFDVDGVELPDKASIIRAREILEELIRRSSETHRSPGEHEYLHRLLRRF